MNSELPLARSIDFTQVLPFDSFQATFFTDENGRVLKTLKHKPIWNLWNQGDPEVRQDILTRELACLTGLNPGLDVRLVHVHIPNGHTDGIPELDIALAMPLFRPDAFLDSRLAQNEEIPQVVFEEIGRRVADFHHSEYCPPADVSLTQFLTELMVTEYRILKEGFPAEILTYNNWSRLFEQFIIQQASQIDRYQQLTGEPIIGHGDIKSSNIIWTDDGDVVITDSAPYQPWRINTRSMDIDFLVTELALLDLDQEAQVVKLAHATGTRDHLKQAFSMQGDNEDAVENLVAEVDSLQPLMDMISEVYRLTIFYRLSKAGKIDPEFEEKCRGRLNTLYDTIGQSTV